MKYVVQYTLPYQHCVMVGIRANNPDAAITKAETLFNQGDIWQDTVTVPLLHDDYDETGDSPLHFTVEQELAEDEPWPELDASVTMVRKRDAAFQAARLLVNAYSHGEAGDCIDWYELDRAHEAALQASPVATDQTPDRSARQCQRLALILEGGMVQAVIADRPDTAPAVAVVEYDTDGYEPEDLCSITQSDGTHSTALVVEHCVESTRIDMDEIFQESGQ